jgi:hypothetical protein
VGFLGFFGWVFLIPTLTAFGLISEGAIGHWSAHYRRQLFVTRWCMGKPLIVPCAESVVLPYLPAFSVTPTQLEVGPDGAQLRISGNRFLSGTVCPPLVASDGSRTEQKFRG